MSELLMVPRWAGDADSDFYPWLRSELQGSTAGLGGIHCSAMLPDKDAPTLEASVASLHHTLDAHPGCTHAVAHSAGCQVLLRGLSERADHGIQSLVLVAPWFDLDEPWESIQPWCKLPFDGSALRARGVQVSALLSDDDPFTSDYEETQAILERELGATVTLVPGGKHFNREHEPRVAEALRALLS